MAGQPPFLRKHYPYNPTTLPANIDRHYLRSKLSQLECPAEMIDYFMGHWERGEEPYHRHSLGHLEKPATPNPVN